MGAVFGRGQNSVSAEDDDLEWAELGELFGRQQRIEQQFYEQMRLSLKGRERNKIIIGQNAAQAFYEKVDEGRRPLNAVEAEVALHILRELHRGGSAKYEIRDIWNKLAKLCGPRPIRQMYKQLAQDPVTATQMDPTVRRIYDEAKREAMRKISLYDSFYAGQTVEK